MNEIFAALIGAGAMLGVAAIGWFISHGRLLNKVDSTEKAVTEAAKDNKTLRADMERHVTEIRKEFADHRVYVAREFVDRDELNQVAKQITDAVALIGERLEKGFQHVAQRIDALVDRRGAAE